MPSLSRVVEIKMSEAELLADLYGIIIDLDTAAQLCSKVIELSKTKTKDLIIEEGLVGAAVIRYGRCFTTGVRVRLGLEDLAELNAEELEAHNYFYALRNRFVAHSISPFEETYVTATAREQDGEKFPITSLNPGHHRIVLSAEIAESLTNLISSVKTLVKKKVTLEEQGLLDIIQGLPLETIHAGDLYTPRQIQASDVHMSRKKNK